MMQLIAGLKYQILLKLNE